MATLDEAAQVLILLEIRLVEVPCRYVQATDPRQTPALGEVVQIRTAAIGGIEEGPQAVGPEGRREPQLGEIVQLVGEALITPGAGG